MHLAIIGRIKEIKKRIEKHESTVLGISLLFFRDFFAKKWYSQS